MRKQHRDATNLILFYRYLLSPQRARDVLAEALFEIGDIVNGKRLPASVVRRLRTKMRNDFCRREEVLARMEQLPLSKSWSNR